MSVLDFWYMDEWRFTVAIVSYKCTFWYAGRKSSKNLQQKHVNPATARESHPKKVRIIEDMHAGADQLIFWPSLYKNIFWHLLEKSDHKRWHVCVIFLQQINYAHHEIVWVALLLLVASWGYMKPLPEVEILRKNLKFVSFSLMRLIW